MHVENEQPNFGAGCWEYRDYLSLKDVLRALKAASVVLYHTLKKKSKGSVWKLLLCCFGLRGSNREELLAGILPGVLTKRSESVCAGFCGLWFSFVCQNCSDFPHGKAGSGVPWTPVRRIARSTRPSLGQSNGDGCCSITGAVYLWKILKVKLQLLVLFFSFSLFLFVQPETSRSHRDCTSLWLLAAWMGCFQRFPTCPLLLPNAPQSVRIPFVIQEQKEIWYPTPVLK